MNERIQELHEQALKDCEEYLSDILNYHQLYRTRFAELIIKECASVFSETDGDMKGTYRDQIKDHFGID